MGVLLKAAQPEQHIVAIATASQDPEALNVENRHIHP